MVLDEVQQFINNNADIAHDVQERGHPAPGGEKPGAGRPGSLPCTVVLQKKEQAKGQVQTLVSQRSGEMQKRFQEIIEEQKALAEGTLRSRICALVFLINKLPREGADTGVRATPEHLADLLTDDLGDSATDLRAKVPGLVQALANDGVLMEIEGLEEGQGG